MNSHQINQRLAHRLGYAGLVPFILLTLGCWLAHPDWLGDFIRGQLAYGIAVLSFLGGMHWSAALMSAELSAEQGRKALTWGVMPPLIAWSATMFGGFGFAILMAGFIGAYQADKRLFGWYRLPDWFLQLRFRLTCMVVPMLALTVIAANVRG
ncbi:DUF3429 domain-containing protein [Noviherbaspirillum cavernae]|uniref:DUF3429 domain-containing protein n=1 Tax=Noviherbaspirillum cavernae TaxID=2320862 RepID=A0A418X400_9BURK|nr:DUF3429 domain-containing protein [Noviherbaspirillum cavernae]RJG07207.1 DUF3429 domain-containing protein [Noviherbaspirillum cavernae]